MKKRRNYKELPDIEVSAELDAHIRATTAAADEELEAARVNFRWGKKQVDMVKRIANLMGIPYQTYIKQVVYKQALADLQAASDAQQRERVAV
jgi:predicted DNA binding CopG/RHH family protein